MYHSLTYDSKDPKYVLLGKIFDYLDSKKSLDSLSRCGIRNRSMMIFSIKVLFISMYFSCNVSYVVSELNRNEKLRKFINAPDEIPSTEQVYEFLSRFSGKRYCQYVNSIFSNLNGARKKHEKFIVDATPSACDFNKDKKYITKEHLERMKLKWSYATTKGAFIGFKVTVVLNQRTMAPVSILVHSGAPHDTKIFDEVLKDLKTRRIIRKGDVLLFDKGYYSYKNYLIGITKYKIIPVIFPNNRFDINKLEAMISYPLDFYKPGKDIKKLKQEMNRLARKLFRYLENWKELKPVRGIIEDFFKVAKDAFGLGKFHKYTVESMTRTIFLCLLLTTLVIQNGFKSKTKLQRLAEGDVVQDTPVQKKSKSKKKNKTKLNKSNKHNTKQDKLKVNNKHYQSSLENFRNHVMDIIMVLNLNLPILFNFIKLRAP